MIKFLEIYNKSLIKESKQVGIVYHFTSLDHGMRIVDKNILRSYNSSKRYDGETISTTRDKNFIKSRNNSLQISGGHIGIMLDGDLLSNRYKVAPYDDTIDPDGTNNIDDRAQFGDEQEEIWYGKTLESDMGFKNVKKYIKKIILTKRLKKDLVDNEDDGLVKAQEYFEWNYNTSPQTKLQNIIDYFESQRITVEVQK